MEGSEPESCGGSGRVRQREHSEGQLRALPSRVGHQIPPPESFGVPRPSPARCQALSSQDELAATCLYVRMSVCPHVLVFQSQNEVTLLRNEVAQLKQLLLAHKDCPVTALQKKTQGYLGERRLLLLQVEPQQGPQKEGFVVLGTSGFAPSPPGCCSPRAASPLPVAFLSPCWGMWHPPSSSGQHPEHLMPLKPISALKAGSGTGRFCH